MTLGDKLFSFNGRLRRRDWWLLSILLFLTQTATTRVLDTLLFGADDDLAKGDIFTWFLGPADATGGPLVAFLIALIFLWPVLAITVKRCQDRGNRGFAVVAIQLAAIAGHLLPPDAFETAGRAADASNLAVATPMILYGVGILVGSIYQLVVLGFLDGTPGSNRFGQSPKAVSEGPPAFIAPGGLG